MADHDDASRVITEVEAAPAAEAPSIVDRDDVIQGYRIIFGRDPENDFIIEHHRRVSPTTWDLVHILLSSQEYRSKLFAGAHLSIKKCYYEVYLSHSLAVEDRVSCFLKTHQVLTGRFTADVVDEIYFSEAEVWKSVLPEHELSVTLSTPRLNLTEGELCLIFKRNGTHLYTISFSFVPGGIVGSACDCAVLISRMQGTRGEQDGIRAASKTLREIHPQTVLFAILCGIGQVAGAGVIACVEARNHIYFQESVADVFVRTYDDFITAQGAATIRQGYLVLDLPVEPKPLNLIATIHRLRTKKKRILKDAIAQEAVETVSRWLR